MSNLQKIVHLWDRFYKRFCYWRIFLVNINNVEIEYINKRIQDLNPKVLVAIPVFNGEKIIIEAIQDVYNQSYQDFCVVIADN